MNVVVCGNGKSGSWQVRGGQLGAAIGAVVQPAARDVSGYDKMIVVKRVGDYIAKAHQAKLPVIYDIVDAWQSRVDSEAGRAECMRWLASQIDLVKPAGIVAATEVMAEDCRHLTDVPVLALPHHARPGIAQNPIREKIKRVGYEGSQRYLGWWEEFLQTECKLREWEFVINPPALSDVDIVVAVRSYNGYAPRNWKSNVKLANAQGSGTPCVLNREAGYFETRSGVELFADTKEEMIDAFDLLDSAGPAGRREMAERMRKSTPRLELVAALYTEWLTGEFS